ncbi:MAG TPA: class I tRNA ligase family protein, partial [Polyangiaceae bacterium]|nr:class I tRNA ligase family protein [Polyangiaceae bacterium]
TDTFLELAKPRAWQSADGPAHSEAERSSAIAALRLGLSVLLRLFAPVLPYITEEIWSWVYAAETGRPSIHGAPWPTVDELADVPAPADVAHFDRAVDLFTAINKAKADAQVSAGRVVESLVVEANAATLERVAAVRDCALEAARVNQHRVNAVELEDGLFRIVDAVFAPKG